MLQQGTIYFNEPKEKIKVRVEGVKNEKRKSQNQQKLQIKKKENELAVEVKPESHQQKFDRIINRSSEALLHIKTHLFFEMEPKEIIIDITKVSIVTKPFLGAKEVISVPVENISEVTIESIPMFATLRIHDKENQYGEKVHTIKFLKRNEAVLAQRVIQGLLVSKKNEIDLGWVEPNGLLQRLEELGKTEETG